jgi:REP element-mobilizing transposase RayT
MGRRERVLNRQIAQRARGEAVRRGPGRPKKAGSVSHAARPELAVNEALLVTLKVQPGLPNLRSGGRFRAIREVLRAFRKVDLTDLEEEGGAGEGFRLAHFSVLGDHIHLIVEADSKLALSRGMQKLTMSVSRRLNALSVRRCGGNLRPRGALSLRPGWLGKVFRERYHARPLRTPTETRNAIAYVIFNADKHFGSRKSGPVVPDPYSSAVYFDGFFELATFCRLQASTRGAIGPPNPFDSGRADVPVTAPKGWLLRAGWRRSLGNPLPPSRVSRVPT